jgi:hypothetical protein
MSDSVSFALLCPVPDEHLEEGVSVAVDTGYVCYGSNAWEVFRELDKMRGNEDVPVLFYPSYEDIDSKLTYQITYVGWYFGHVTSDAEKHADDKAQHRPKTVDKYRGDYDSPHHWGLFWRVRDLRKLAAGEQAPVGSLISYKSGTKRLDKPPRGPSVVVRPVWLR